MSRICTGLNEEIAAFRTRPLGHVDFPYLSCDATYLKGRTDHAALRFWRPQLGLAARRAPEALL